MYSGEQKVPCPFYAMQNRLPINLNNYNKHSICPFSALLFHFLLTHVIETI